MGMKGKYTCIFGGGAVRGLAYVGAIKALKELNFNVQTLVGSSVGAIVAGFLAVGYDADEINDMLNQVNFELFRDIHFGLNKEFALSKGNIFTDWLRESIEKKYYGDNYKKGEHPPVTFRDITKNFIVLTTDLNTFTPVEFSNFETPDFEIANAIRISCSMPGLMTPVEQDEKRLVDGDLLKGMPLWMLSKHINTQDSRILEFRLEGDTVSKDNNMFAFLNSIYSCMTSATTDFIMDTFGQNDRFDYIKITTGDVIVIDFNLSPQDRQMLIKSGYKDTMKYLTEKAVSKKMLISAYYKNIITFMEKLIRALKYNDISDTTNILKSLFLYMSDAYKYIDTDIFESLRTLKNDILSAPKKKSWFKGEKFRDRNLYIDKADILKKVIKAKNDELADYISNIN